MSTRSGRVRASVIETSPSRSRKGVSPNRSPARTRKSSPARNSSPPARAAATRKSPSRKSPSRKPASKFPARKSPSRATKEETDVKPAKSPAKRPGLKSEISVKLEDLTGKLEIYRSTRSSRRTDYSIQDVTNADELPDITKVNGVESIDVYGLRNRRSIEEFAQRRSSRLKEFMENVPDIRRSLSKSASKSVSKSISQSIDTYSDEENSSEEARTDKSQSVTRKLATPIRNNVNKISQISGRWEFGGRIGSAVLMLLIPITVFGILSSCSKGCNLKSLIDLSSLQTWKAWFGVQALSVISAQLAIQALIAVVPVCGAKADRMDDSGSKYNFNAFFSSIITVNLVFALHFFGVFNKDLLLEEYLRLTVVSYIFAVLLSIVLYVKQPSDVNELNPYGTTGYKLYDYFMGKEIHPFIKNLDVKIWISRVSNISALTLAVLIFKQGINLQTKDPNSYNYTLSIDNYKQILNDVQLQPTILLYSMMQITYLLSFIMREYRITATFYWQSEGVGYLQTVSSALFPFYFTTVSKFVADSKLSLSTNTLIIASVIYVLGFFIMLLSNSIKYEFRRNPLQPSLANLDSMPTFHGKKLLVSSLWGILRHPNYAGDILIHIALALPGIITQQFMAAAPALLTIVVLLHRAWRDHARCKRRYGAAWQRYCKRVPSVVVPKVL